MDSSRPLLEGVHLKSLNSMGISFLEAPFREGEIKEAIWGCEGSKSPGLDGYSFSFIRRC